MRLWLKITILLLVLAGVGGGVYFLIVQRANNADIAATPLPGLPTAPGADLSRRSELSGDDDSDGLLNGDELTWGTDPLRADTDGDGYLDGEEVAANHDPRIPAPNDKLDGDRGQPASIAQRLATLTQAPTVDQYLSDDVSLQVPDNLTQEYEQAVPAEQRSPAALADFVRARPVTTTLPRPGAEEVPAAVQNTAAQLQQYLSLAQNDDVLSNPSRYIDAQYELQSYGKPNGINFMAERFRALRVNLLTTPVPAAAVPVHTLLLAYTAAQAELFDQIAEYPTDQVKSKAATHHAEMLDQTYFPIFQREFERLHELQEAL